MDGEKEQQHQETLHGETLVSDLLQKELMQLDLTGCQSPEYSTLLRIKAEADTDYENGDKSTNSLASTASNRITNASKSETGIRMESIRKEESGTRKTTGNSFKTRSGNPTGNRLLTDRDAVDIIEMVEQDAGILSQKLKLFNRKHKPLPSIDSTATNKQ